MPAAAPGANGSSAGSQEGSPTGSLGQAASIQPYLAQQAQQTQHAQRAAAPDSAYDNRESEYSSGSVSTFTQFLRDYSLRFWDPIVCCKLRKRYVHRPKSARSHATCALLQCMRFSCHLLPRQAVPCRSEPGMKVSRQLSMHAIGTRKVAMEAACVRHPCCGPSGSAGPNIVQICSFSHFIQLHGSSLPRHLGMVLWRQPWPLALCLCIMWYIRTSKQHLPDRPDGSGHMRRQSPAPPSPPLTRALREVGR